MKMKQVMSHNINNGLLNIIRRTDPMITGIEEVRSQTSDGRGETCTLDGRKAGASAKGIVIMDGKKVVKR